ncbi:hypothetical protein [Oceanospirillum sediminis]|uniref:Uncharacterized protein n=1 Tax=Oceanospirillum sediminis TaxID=2760088 RepID=A0A839IMG3_9GAMM|nr:hypothetical protein [Oceanospirillum sediminis]MBB1485910.1 hypothetical protein [Oceanospirillum sediminis]
MSEFISEALSYIIQLGLMALAAIAGMYHSPAASVGAVIVTTAILVTYNNHQERKRGKTKQQQT